VDSAHHIVDLRARVWLRHALIEQHCQWQQRIQAVLYHHGCPHRRGLMVGDGRALPKPGSTKAPDNRHERREWKSPTSKI
jgi:hypothetical protein